MGRSQNLRSSPRFRYQSREQSDRSSSRAKRPECYLDEARELEIKRPGARFGVSDSSAPLQPAPRSRAFARVP